MPDPSREARQRAGPSAPLILIRAAGAGCALIGLVGGVPLGLTRLMTALPIPGQPLDLGTLLHPDNGSALLLLLLAVAWAAWVAVVGSLVVEVWAAARRVPAPTLRGLRLTQMLASHLVAAVFLVATVAAGASGSAADDSVDLSAAVQLAGDLPNPPALPVGDIAERGRRAGPTVVTTRHDTLWMLAELHLGSGERYREIAELNQGVEQADGRELGPDGRLYPGWTLALPADARTEVERTRIHHVDPGESLWRIAQEELGSGHRFPEIFQANAGDLQHDGRHLTDPDLIRPGWELAIPSQGSRPGDPAGNWDRPVGTPQPPAATLPGIERGPGPGNDRASAPPVLDRGPAASNDRPVLPGLDRGPSSVERSPAPPAGGDPSAAEVPPELDRAPAAHDDRPVPPVLDRGRRDDLPDDVDTRAPTAIDRAGIAGDLQEGLGGSITLPSGAVLGVMALAGLAGRLSSRRRQFQRMRRPGEPIGPLGPAERALEVEAATAQRSPRPGLLEAALRQLGEQAVLTGRQLPQLRLVLVDDAQILLELAEPSGPALPPFRDTGNGSWALDVDLLQPIGLGQEARAYPALVTIGVDEADRTVMVDLASQSVLRISGDPAQVDRVTRGLMAEVALGPAAEGTERVIDLRDPGFATDLDPGELEIIRADAPVSQLTRILRTRAAAAVSPPPEQDRAQPGIGEEPGLVDVRSPTTAGTQRVDEIGLEEVPALVLTDRNPESEHDRSVALISAASKPGAGATLKVARDGSATLDLPRPHLERLVVRPQRMSAGEAGTISSLLRGSEVPDDPDHRGRPEGLGTQSPRIRMLGELRVDSASGKVESSRIGRLAETAAFIHLHPDSRPSLLQGALWPGRVSNPQSCRQMLSRTRTWLGRDESGAPYLMPLAESGARLRLSPSVTSDWSEFQGLAVSGLRDGSGTEDLAAALRLVRGRPFGPLAGREIPWAQVYVNEMICLITDVAHELATRHLAAGRPDLARGAALHGLRTECESVALEQFARGGGVGAQPSF